MKLVGIKYKETEFEGKKYPKYECHLVDNRRLPGMTGATVLVYDVRPSILDDNFGFVIGGEYDFVIDEGKVIAVFEVNAPAVSNDTLSKTKDK